MTNFGRFFRTILPALLVAAGFAVVSSAGTPALASPLQVDNSHASGFLGAWCAQGDPNKRASISSNQGGFLTLTNENGDTSVGTADSQNRIVAPQWQLVTGTLTPDGSRINWSNGTFWARCDNGGGGGGGGYGYRINLTGKWFPNGNRSLSCSIQQRHGNLNLQNEVGQTASGSFTGKHHIVTNWNGNTIHGKLSPDDNRIDWDNGTYWVRFRVY